MIWNSGVTRGTAGVEGERTMGSRQLRQVYGRPGSLRARFGGCFLFLLFPWLTSWEGDADRTSRQAAPGAIGIVEVPSLFETGNGGAEPLRLRQRPSEQSPIVATVAAPDDVEAAEFAYERSGALVFGRDGGWSALRTNEGEAGWMAPSDAGPFHPLEALLDGGGYLTDAWDQTVHHVPGAQAATPVPSDSRRRIVGVLQGRVIRQAFELDAGDDPDELRNRYRASGSSLRSRADGTRILTLELGTLHSLLEEPRAGAAVVGEVESHRAGWVLAASSGVPAEVPVFERREGWFQVALRADASWQETPRVWLEDSGEWRFRPAVDPAEAAAFMERVWGPATRYVRINQHRRLAGELWLEVEVLEDSPCLVVEPDVVARGWIPAHGTGGAPTAWFHARGC